MTADAGLDGPGAPRDVKGSRAGMGTLRGAVLVLATALLLAGIGFVVQRCRCGGGVISNASNRGSEGESAPQDTVRDPTPARSAGMGPSAHVDQRRRDHLNAVLRRLAAADLIDVPAADRDQHGNPVVVRGGRRTDPESGLPYEIWLKSPVMEFVLVTAGEFAMGSPESEMDRDPDEAVPATTRILCDFYLGKYEVTEAQVFSVISPGFTGYCDGPAHPYSFRSWNGWHRYLAQLNKRAGREGTPLFRLPTEAEWEYTCRAGSQTCFCSGDSTSSLLQVGWFNENSKRECHRVGMKSPNAWGLYDMHGNVWEWCEDEWIDVNSLAPGDRTRQGKGGLRVVRGGSWNLYSRCCRSANRSGTSPRIHSKEIGMRIVLSLK
jgi:formylglycine-generating enzyme required for sulfatase activity